MKSERIKPNWWRTTYRVKGKQHDFYAETRAISKQRAISHYHDTYIQAGAVK